MYAPKVGVPDKVTGLREEREFRTGWGSLRPVLVPVTAGVSTAVRVEASRVTGVDEVVEGER